VKSTPTALDVLRLLHGRSLTQEARETRIARSTLCELYTGQREPSPVHRHAIERLYGVPWDSLRQPVTPLHLILPGTAP
jgi:transcriptional regulator with XRE-family HTH domain